MPRRPVTDLLVGAALLAVGCGGQGPMEPVVVEGKCEIAQGAAAPELLRRIGCTADFQALASLPIDAALPGARSVKVVLDQAGGDALYFQNSVLYQIHYQFAQAHLSGRGLPVVPSLATFNTSEYFSPDRRFVLGAVTYYEGPKAWTLELSPYDTASATMIEKLYRQVKAAAFFAPALRFHPTSDAVAVEAKRLPAEVKVITTDELYAAIDYQPLTLGTGIGRLHFAKAATLASEYLSYQDLVVLDEVPNDIAVVQGLITQQFQTPLSHVNVLSQNRHTPNMGLREAMTNPKLRALEGKLVELQVGASSWSVREATQGEAEAFWKAHQPKPITLPALDLAVTGLVDIDQVTAVPAMGQTLRQAIKKAVTAFGGKSAQYSVLARTKGVPIKKAFAIPIFYYDQFMKQNQLYERIDALLGDRRFTSDPMVRNQKLTELTAAMLAAPIDGNLQSLLKAKLAADYPGATIRFRTSTNSEDLDGFPCAGCYDSHTGDPAKWNSVLKAIRETWASIWKFRTFEERSYYGIAHKSVGMALLVHQNFPNEEANGVAVTANPFDAAGIDPAFYVNVQAGGSAEVVAPPPGVQSDQFLYFFSSPNQPITYLAHSNLIPAGTNVLSTLQIHELGVALDAVHKAFSPAYGPAAGNRGWYAMDVEFKFDDDAAPGKPAALYVKQARPYPGRGQ